MYGPQGVDGFITGDYAQTSLGLTSLNDTCLFEVQVKTSQYDIYRRTVVHPVALVRSSYDAPTHGAPCAAPWARRSNIGRTGGWGKLSSALYTLTYFPDTSQDVIVSFPQFMEFADGQFNSVSEIPRKFFLMTLVPGKALAAFVARRTRRP